MSELAPGQMRPIDLPHGDPLAIHNVGGTLYVTGNLCTHALAFLTDGFLDGDEVECPMHGGRFNVRTGAATRFPCEDALKTREVIVDDGIAYIDHHEPTGLLAPASTSPDTAEKVPP